MQKQQDELTPAELAVLNYLKSLDPNERTTFKRMSQFVGINERTCKTIVQSLREKKDYWIVSDEKPSRLGTWLTDDPIVWEQYKKRRIKESQSIGRSLSKM